MKREAKGLFQKFVPARHPEAGFSLVELMVMILIMGILAIVATPAFIRQHEKIQHERARSQEAGIEPETQPSPEPTTVAAREPVDVPWEILGAVGVGLIGLGVIAIIGVFLVKNINKERHARAARLAEQARIEAEEQRKKDENMESWNKYFNQHDDVTSRYAKYELDVEKMIKYPLFSRVGHPVMKEFYSAMRNADRARPEAGNEFETAHGTVYGNSVASLVDAFETAESTAVRIGWKGLPESDKKSLKTALSMAKIVKNDGASANEREVAYKRLLSETQGLLVIPEKAILQLEESVRKALPVGSAGVPTSSYVPVAEEKERIIAL